MSTSKRLRVQVRRISLEAEATLSLVLAAAEGETLPQYEAGAHIDIHFPNHVARSYTLVGLPRADRCYRVAIALDPKSRGGSRYVHETLRVGDWLELSGPRNNFKLVDDGANTILIAGGIGITPFIGMIERLDALERNWRLYYRARTSGRAAYLDKLRNCGGRVDLIFGSQSEVGALNFQRIIADAAEGAHFYCCGPQRMLDGFIAATRGLPGRVVHFEYFSAPPIQLGSEGFLLRLARSDRELAVLPGQSILQCVTEAGIDVPHTCDQGVCGACETKVLGGIPDHRDLVLTPEERSSNTTMMICCSTAASQELVLDL